MGEKNMSGGSSASLLKIDHAKAKENAQGLDQGAEMLRDIQRKMRQLGQEQIALVFGESAANGKLSDEVAPQAVAHKIKAELDALSEAASALEELAEAIRKTEAEIP